jgi:4-phospho-D-threonate 3-dehydrogenase / 4-phospho-D-erythronate 3-dehydrogenase
MPTTPPRLALTMGDPAGIGPEIVARTLYERRNDAGAVGFAVGDPATLRKAVEVCGLQIQVREIEAASGAEASPDAIDVLPIATHGATSWGEVSAAAGQVALDAIERATQLALTDEVQAVVTAPINKEAIWAAGSEHLGHTEFLGALTGSARVQTMFVVRGLKIFFTTRHMSMREALDKVTRSSVRHAIDESWTSLQLLADAGKQPRLAVSAINPHGGEGGSFGTEEIEHIGPACDDAREDGLDVVGPVPADAVFHQGLQGRFDGVLCHLHDQGHIAAKTLDFEEAITVTMGLPILRTSVDHGTAFDIAGQGIASAAGMSAAYDAAVDLARFAPRLREEFGSTAGAVGN